MGSHNVSRCIPSMRRHRVSLRLMSYVLRLFCDCRVTFNLLVYFVIFIIFIVVDKSCKRTHSNSKQIANSK